MSGKSPSRAVRAQVGAVLLLSMVAASTGATDFEEYGQQLYARGCRAYGQGSYVEAQTLFERSFAYSPSRNALWNLAASHLGQGHRDLAVGFLVRYMARNPSYLESREMQRALAAIADSPPQIGDRERRHGLGRQVNEVTVLVEESRSTPISGGERRFGPDVHGTEAERIRAAMKQLGDELFREGVRLATSRRYEEALPFFERCFAYTPPRNAWWNIAACHLSQGHRDFTLQFIDGYLDLTPEARESAEVQAVVSAIADEPPSVPNYPRRFDLWRQLSEATAAALGEEPESDGSD